MQSVNLTRVAKCRIRRQYAARGNLGTAGTVVHGQGPIMGDTTMKRLAGKVALITGGARGMGAATSRLFAAEGARVIIADVLDAEGGALSREIGETAMFLHHDVSDEDSWRQLLQDAVARFGGVDVLVHN